MSDPLVIAGRTFQSRLIVGTGKYPSHPVMQAAHRAAGAEMVTVAVRRVDISRRSESLLDYIDPAIFLLPNTAACYTAEEAIRTATEPDAHGWRETTVRLESLPVAINELLRFGSHLEVLAPVELREAIAAEAGQMLDRYRSPA